MLMRMSMSTRPRHKKSMTKVRSYSSSHDHFAVLSTSYFDSFVHVDGGEQTRDK